MRTIITTTCIAALAFNTPLTYANPVGGSVVGGRGATITGQGSASTTINQTANKVIINWQDFSIGAGEVTRFIQPSATASALNRVVSGNPSLIYGSLQANGRVFVINPNGILVGPSGQIDTKGFIASTMNVRNADFLSKENLIFSGDSTAGIRNEGAIQALGGNVFLIAHTVDNAGTINAPQGTVGLAAGSQVQLMQAGNERVSVLAGNSSAPADKGVNNSGTIAAASAELKAAGGNIYALAINNGGVVRANGIVQRNGHIYLGVTGGNIENSGTLSAHNADGSGGQVIVDGGHNAAAPATVISSGTIEARGDAPGTQGGTVEVLGDHVGLFDNALVDVSGSAGGGAALLGGDYHGSNPSIQNASRTFIGAGARIQADALVDGNGGKVVVWADDATWFEGNISARGGTEQGDGGFAEVSGKNTLVFQGAADLSAPHGSFGTLLLDPATLTIINGAGPGTLDGSLPSILAADADAGGNTIAEQTLEGLGATANVLLEATGDVTIQPLTDHVLNLKATSGSLTIHADADNDGAGNFSMDNADTIQTRGGDVTITGVGINVGSINTTPTTAIDGGNVTITSHTGGAVTVNGSVVTTGGPVVNAAGRTAGNVTINAAGALTMQDVVTTGGAANSGGAARNGGDAGGIDLTGGAGVAINGSVVGVGGAQAGGGSDGAGATLTLHGTGTFLLNNPLNDVANLTANVDGPLTYKDANALTIVNGARTTFGGAAGSAVDISTVNGDLTVANDVVNDVDAGTSTVSLTAGGAAATDRTLTVNGEIRGTGGITLVADQMTLQSSSGIDAGSSTATLRQFEGGTAILFNNSAAAGTLELSGAELNNITAATLRIGDVNSGNVSSAQDVDLGAKNVVITTGGNIDFGNNNTLKTTGNATLTAGGDLVGDSTGTAHVDANIVTLQTTGLGKKIGTDAANPFAINANQLIATTVGAVGDDIFISQAGGLTALTLSAGAANATLTAKGGVVENGGIITANKLTIKTLLDGGGAITLDNPANEVSSIDLRARNGADSNPANGNITYEDATGFAAGQVTTAGDIQLTALTGSILDDGTAAQVASSGASATTAVTANGPGGTIGTALNPLDIGSSGATATVNLNSSPGAVHVNVATSGNVDFTTSTDNGTDITTSFSQGSRTYNATYLDGAGGNFTLNANGNILDTAGVTVLDTLATLSLRSTVANGTIGALGKPIITSATTVRLNTSGASGDAFVTGASGLNLGASSVGGDLTAAAATGDLTDGGAVVVNGNGTFTASTSGANIVLDSGLNVSGTIGLQTSGIGNATLVTANPVDFATSSVGGNLTVTSTGGGVSQLGDISAGGLSITANGITTLGGNNHVSTLAASVTGSGHTFSFTDADPLTVGTVNGLSGVATADSAVSLTADTLQVAQAINSGAARTTLQPKTAGMNIDLGSESGGKLSLTDAELDQVTASVLQVGSVTAGAIDVSAAVSPANANTMALVNNGPVTESAAGSINVNNLRVSSLGPVDLSGANNVNVLAIASSGAGNGITFHDSDSVTIGAVDTVNGVLANNGPIKISAGANLTINNTPATSDVDAGTSTVDLTTGANSTLTIATGADVHGDTKVTLNADAIIINVNGTVTAGTGNASDINLLVQPVSAGRDISLGTEDPTRLSLTQTELNGFTGNTLQIGNTGVNDIRGANSVVAPPGVAKMLVVSGATTVQSANSQLAALLAGAILPVPKVEIASFSAATISADEAAKLKVPGSISVLFLELKFPPAKDRKYKIEDISKWTSGGVSVAGETSGPQQAQ